MFHKMDSTVHIRQIVHLDTSMLDTMADWMYHWWGEPEGHSIEVIKCYLEHSIQETRLPQTFGMFLNEQLIGMYQFRLDDLFVRPDIYPWLANVYIDEKYRNQGYGQYLMQSVCENAKRYLTFPEIYLFTKHIGFYERFGWEFISEIDTYLEDGRIQRLYRLKLDR